MEPKTPTPLDDFLFDLNGYLILKNAVEPSLLDDLNRAFDDFPPLEPMDWWGNAQRRDYTAETGFELHNCVEAGQPFEALIDHPGWIGHVRRYCGEQDSYVEGLFIDEAIASIRRSGGHHPVHSGGYKGALRGSYGFKDGVFRCGQCNVILALTDIGEGDGATMVVPGSHKSHFPHPLAGDYARGDRMDTLPGAVPVHLSKGDAVLFCDGLMHGGSSRTKEGGERRVTIYRYGPLWGATRFGYEYSQGLLDRVTPAQRRILQPVAPTRPPASPNHA
jgi:hypothetical protein